MFTVKVKINRVLNLELTYYIRCKGWRIMSHLVVMVSFFKERGISVCSSNSWVFEVELNFSLGLLESYL